jgi:hypothetical protein
MSTVPVNYRIILVGGTLALVGLLWATHSGWRVIPLALKLLLLPATDAVVDVDVWSVPE